MNHDENQGKTPMNNNGVNENGHHEEDSSMLTTRQGHPVTHNQKLRTVANCGQATLENYYFLEKIPPLAV